jgi:hypothetical protein
MWLYYYWLKAESQNPLLINRPSNQRDLPEAELARREVRIERRPLPAEAVLEAADLLRIIQASKPTPTAAPEPEELTPGSLEETSLRETGSTFKADELEP